MSKLATLKKEVLAERLIGLGMAKAQVEGMTRPAMMVKIDELESLRDLNNATVEKGGPTEHLQLPTETTGFVRMDEVPPAQETPAQETPPVVEIHSYEEGWTDFVMSKLFKYEMVDGFPSTDGLRRVFQELMGDIISNCKQVIQPPHNENSSRATVKCTIQYRAYGVYDRSSPGTLKTIEEVSDCYMGNSKKPFYYHASATAATMAEGRALRKAMGIKALVTEEMQKPEEIDQQAAEQN
jgi:hypothetical protein